MGLSSSEDRMIVAGVVLTQCQRHRCFGRNVMLTGVSGSTSIVTLDIFLVGWKHPFYTHTTTTAYNNAPTQWRTTYHITTSVWKMPLSWHWTDHSGGHWQQVELRTEMVHAERWWWW